ncbi:MAG TPA: peptidase M28, partial [Bacteroidota bacterium]|nr:peptidase M28 [Bacteroidota bacterium]
MNRLTLTANITLFVFACHGAAQQRAFVPPKGAREVLELVRSSSLMGHIRFLADDALEGRAPGTRGDRLAQAYIASQMEGLGLQPGGDSGTYIQR